MCSTSVDHGSPHGSSWHPIKLLSQLSIWLSISLWNDKYEKDARLCVESPPVLRITIAPISIERGRKRAKELRFRCFSAALRQILVLSQFGAREVILRMILHHFHIHHCFVR